jgi:transcription antitermination factor NusG
MAESAWYVVQVHSRREKWVANTLGTVANEVCLPLQAVDRRWSDRQKSIEVPVFPGYVFALFDIREKPRILSVPGVLALLGSGSRAIPLDRQEIQALQVLERTKVQVQQWPFLRAGDWVVMDGGPLDGLVGFLQESRKATRVVVSVNLLHRSVAAEVDRAFVRPTNPPKRGNAPAEEGLFRRSRGDVA